MLTPDQHLWACALKLEKEQERDALLYATMRVQDLDAEGDHEGAQTWRQIRARILALRKGFRGQRH